MANNSILYVEDHLPSLHLVERLLSVYPYKVLKATTAEDGLELAQKYTPLVILLDIDLPAMDGLSALRLFKQHYYLRHIPVVVITSHDDLWHECRAEGAVSLIHKPVSFGALQDALQRALSASTA